MSSSVALTCLLAVQQLSVTPSPGVVGSPVVVRATAALAAVVPGSLPSVTGQPVADLELMLEFPDGSRRVVGSTDAEGLMRFTGEMVGTHAFSATIDGVRCVAPVLLAPARNRWLLALGCVPLGLALLWHNLRRFAAARRRTTA